MLKLADRENIAKDTYVSLLNSIVPRAEGEVLSEEEKRADWINRMILRALAHPTATWRVIDKLTVCAVYHRECGIHMGTATPTNGNEFDENVGIAVSFAKAMDMEIPDFI